MNKRFTPENITALKSNEIFVFGSNLGGRHAGGAARVARLLFGAVPGQGVGLQGQSYAIPTMQGGPETIKPYVDDFIEFARNNQSLTFYVTRIGCGIAGFKDEEIAPLFDGAFELENVILPESFYNIINHGRQLAGETSGLVFHSVQVEYFPEDLAKAEKMDLNEKIEFFSFLKKNKRYKVVHTSPEAPYPPVLNCTEDGNHVIAITEKTFAIVSGSKLYSNRFEWGIDLGKPALSVVPVDGCGKDFPYGQFVVLLADGTIKSIWSESCIRPLSEESCFIGIASGCGGRVFGLRKDGTVALVSSDKDPALMAEIREWSDICTIEAGPRHIVGLRKDGSVVAAGKPSACSPLKEWRNIRKIYVSKTSPVFGKENDLTFGIDDKGWLHIDGDLWGKGSEFWKRIRAQYDVTDVIENGYAVWVRMRDGALRLVTYYGEMNYREEIDFVAKYRDGLRFMDAYGELMVLVDKDGEFRVLNESVPAEVKWWSFNLMK